MISAITSVAGGGLVVASGGCVAVVVDVGVGVGVGNGSVVVRKKNI